MPGWRERSFFIARHGRLDFFHYDLHGQSLASCLIEIASPKLERLGLIAPKNPAGPQEPETCREEKAETLKF